MDGSLWFPKIEIILLGFGNNRRQRHLLLICSFQTILDIAVIIRVG